MPIGHHNLAKFRFRNVLIIDDEQPIHEMYTAILKPKAEVIETFDQDGEALVDTQKEIFNFNVFHAMDGENGLDIARFQNELSRPIQMAFVDMRMPGWDGVETIQRIHAIDSRIGFIIATGFSDTAEEGLSTRLSNLPIKIIPKPFNISEIYESAHALVKRWNRINSY